ncbi:DUF4007 family protein [Methylobacter marinus]|uniref:DUF4007 family protein n=1 Tax=Methylobacter marinus TaxID=34058 RepID=UPI0003A2F136|nr:DUF4007 family protein [Methylobacter marinus]
MVDVNNNVFSLPLNFPQTFLPERRLLAQLLPFALKNGVGDKVSIGAVTGIPTGSSTGKVEPMIYFSHGMGLITYKKVSGTWQLGLTSVGRLVLQEDPFLSEPHTLWLLHLMLSRRFTLSTPAKGVADAWFSLFCEGGFRLGNRFKQEDFLAFLTERHGEASYLKSLSGVVIRSYFENSCLGVINALTEENKELVRQSAPFEKSFFPIYASYLFLVWDELFYSDNQISLDFFAQQTRFFSIMGWDESMTTQWLSWMADKGIIQVDRYTGTSMLLRLKKTNQVLGSTYSGLI